MNDTLRLAEFIDWFTSQALAGDFPLSFTARAAVPSMSHATCSEPARLPLHLQRPEQSAKRSRTTTASIKRSQVSCRHVDVLARQRVLLL